MKKIFLALIIFTLLNLPAYTLEKNLNESEVTLDLCLYDDWGNEYVLTADSQTMTYSGVCSNPRHPVCIWEIEGSFEKEGPVITFTHDFIFSPAFDEFCCDWSAWGTYNYQTGVGTFDWENTNCGGGSGINIGIYQIVCD